MMRALSYSARDLACLILWSPVLSGGGLGLVTSSFCSLVIGAASSAPALLLETGDYLLLETGDRLLLE